MRALYRYFPNKHAVVELARRMADDWQAAEAIRHLEGVYCELCDDGYDADALVALFTTDGVWDGGPLGRFEGQDELRAFFRGLARSLPFTIHHVTNPVRHGVGLGGGAVRRPRRRPVTAATTRHLHVCPLCEAACGLDITVVNRAVTLIRGDRDDVHSGGYLCPRGTALKDFQHDPDRLRAPLVKRNGRFSRSASTTRSPRSRASCCRYETSTARRRSAS